MIKILAIETSCDETAISLLEAEGDLKGEPKFKVIENLISSQIEMHRPFGGVVPNIAKREHIKNLPILLNSLQTKNLKLETVDLIAVTVGPGLEPALWAGINFAEDLAKKHNIPLIGVNHLEGHIYSFLLSQNSINHKLKTINYPAIALLVSGGHTILIKMDSLTKWKKIGETQDDAVGEAFDKVARILDLPYPGGPEIERIAKNSKLKTENYIDFPRPMIHQKNYNFSFSGLKTAVLYYLRDNPKINKADVAASFQKAAIDVLTKKTFRAVEEFNAKSVILAGGVAANYALRENLQNKADENNINFLCPEFEFNTDNASMIGASAYINYLSLKNKKPKKQNMENNVIGKYKMEANSNLNL